MTLDFWIQEKCVRVPYSSDRIEPNLSHQRNFAIEELMIQTLELRLLVKVRVWNLANEKRILSSLSKCQAKISKILH